jgi:TPR repeat protein
VNKTKAIHWYKKAAALGDPGAKVGLEKLTSPTQPG